MTNRQGHFQHTRWLAVAAVAFGVTLAASELGADTVSRNLPDYVILAISKFQMKNFGFTVAGNIGVNNAGGTFRFGDQSFFPDGTQVASDLVTRIGENSSLWDLFSNPPDPPSIADATIRNQGPTPWAPQPLIAVLPCQAPCTPGSTAVLVPKGGTQTLPPGTYGNVVVSDNATLNLSGGTYCLASLKVGHFSKVEVQGTSTINVPGKVKVNLRSSLLPSTGLGANDVHLDVGGTSVIFSHKTAVTGIVVACNAKLRFGRFSKLRGQFIANSFRADHGPQFTLETCGDGKVDPGEDCDNPSPCCTGCHFTAEDAPCPDGDLCNGDETCNALGQCVPGTPPDCRDTNPCTADGCNPQTGCFHDAPAKNGDPCDDSTLCNGHEICNTGVCVPGTPPDCNDHDACTIDSCDAQNGCEHTIIPNCRPCTVDGDCDNHNACDGLELCVGGQCASGTPPDCDDDNACTSDGCNPVTGCTHTSDEGEPCDDQNDCTNNDACHDSACGGMVIDCNDGDPCTADDCNPSGGCTHDPIQGCGSPGGAFCTLTQGAYGAGNGAANGPQGWITLNPGVLPATIGGSPSVTIGTQVGLEAFMPTNSGPNEFCGNATPSPCPGNVVINVPGDVPDPQGTGSQGYGAGTLAGQTLAMTLNVALSDNGFNPPGLSSLPLPSTPFCTCAPSSATAGPFSFSTCILTNATTVNDLLVLANQALRGVPLSSIDSCLTYSDIDAALDALNNGFDECREFCPCP